MTFFNVLTENVWEVKRSNEFIKVFWKMFSWLQNYLNFDLLVEGQVWRLWPAASDGSCHSVLPVRPKKCNRNKQSSSYGKRAEPEQSRDGWHESTAADGAELSMFGCNSQLNSCVQKSNGGWWEWGVVANWPSQWVSPCGRVGGLQRQGGGCWGGDSRCVQKYIICGLDCPHN